MQTPPCCNRLCKLAYSLTLILIALAASASTALAADNRPVQILYDMPGEIPTMRLETGPIRSVEVEIMDHSLSPRLTIMDESVQLRWVNHSRTSSRIVFEREVAAAMTCHSLVNFSIKEDELKSAELRPLDVANFCKLAPGRYPYRIIRSDPASGASLKIAGVLIVEPTSPARTMARSE